MLCIEVCVFFFFKQKTAYEMRISDWSSDVCSSDLGGGELRRFGREIGVLDARLGFRQIGDGRRQIVDRRLEPVLLRTQVGALRRDRLDRVVEDAERSEEHTSELQSLMRISYAVFCLKKKK